MLVRRLGRFSVLAVAAVTACGVGPQAAPGPNGVTSSSPAATSAPATTSSAAATTAAPRVAPAVVAPAAVRVGQSVYVNVSVATLWTSYTAPRSIDAKAVSAPVDIRGWLAAMSTAARRGLGGRVETQALYGDRLLVTGVRTGWLRVVAVGQPTHRDSRGYPGWVPSRQVTTTSPAVTSRVATVVRLTSWLRSAAGARVVEVSIGTRLPVLAVGTTRVAVASPTRARLYVAVGDVVVRSPTAAAESRTAASVLSTARRFIGRPYLWGGRSGFAVDCSGFTQLVYRMHGIVIPRDADDQARAGRAASLSALHTADLLFFRDGTTIGHVGFYVGSGQMLHAPQTGMNVQVTSKGRPVLARRYL